MKNLKQVILLFVILGSSVNLTYATSSVLLDEFITTFSFANVQEGYKLYIKDSEQSVVYSETLMKSGDYHKRFDLRSLDNGSYSIELDRDINIEIKEFTISNSKITYTPTAKVIYKPSFRLKNNHLYVSQFSDNKIDVIVSIYYNRELIHEDQFTGSALVGRIYQLAQDKPGLYTTVLTVNGRKYYENFNL